MAAAEMQSRSCQRLRVLALLRAVTVAGLLSLAGLAAAHTGTSSSVVETSTRCNVAGHVQRQKPRSRPALSAIRSRAEALEILGLKGEATQEEVRKAFRAAVKASHPDTGGDVERFHLIKQAFDVASGKAHGIPGRHKPSNPRWAPGSRGQTRWDQGEGDVGGSARARAWQWARGEEEQELKQVWESMGFDPYTGTFYGEADAPDAPYVVRPEPAKPEAKREKRQAASSGQTSDMVRDLFSAAFVAVIALMMVMVPKQVDADLSKLAPPESDRWYGAEYAFMARAAKMTRAPLLLVERERPTKDEALSRAGIIGRHLLAAMDESQGLGPLKVPKFKDISVVVPDVCLPDVLEFLTEEGSPAGLSHEGSEKQSERPLMQLGRSRTGQRVFLVGAESDQFAEPVGTRMQELDFALQSAKPDLVLLDMSKEAFQDRSEEFSVWAGHDLRHGVDLMKSDELQSFQQAIV